MNDQAIEIRAEAAEKLWAQGFACEARGELQQAYELFTEAHDLILDCARLHQYAHEQLRRVNWAMGNYGELVTDWALHFFAPLGVFGMVSYFSKRGTFGSEFCRR